ncbi:MAG: ABC transporter ATP-binding protein [Proteobacteria bacterium]|jgi:sulfonate transport system ATP-binding protein|nr:ABC transporter ATP-binding protein [Pseudomonadota bacterium]
MLEISNISKIFKNNEKDVAALQKTNLLINDHEIISLVGQSGCGKSTLLRIIGGLEKASTGFIKLNNKIIKKPSSNIGMVFQDPRLMPWLNVYDNIKLSILNENKKQQKVKISKTLQKVGLENCEKLWPRELSGGMAQRVAIARALVREPKVLLLDEPFSALDSFTKTNLHQHVKELWASLKLTIIMVTHDINEATSMSDRILIVQKPGEKEDKNTQIININNPRSDLKNVKYNELIKNSIFKESSIKTL